MRNRKNNSIFYLLLVQYLDLPLHGDAEECQEVHDQDGPEHGNVEQFEEGTAEGDNCSLGSRVPEFELGEASDKRPKLFVLSCR